MKHIKFALYGVKALLLMLIFLAQSNSAYAANDDCWVDLYKNTQFKGEQIRLKGPIELNDLLNVQQENWDKKIESIIVGPKATLTVFENKNLKLTLTAMADNPVLMRSLGITTQDILEDSELIFGKNTHVHSFGEFDFNHKIRSLKIECVK